MRSDLKKRKERMAPSFQWWAKESHRGTPVVVKMENPNWSSRTKDKGHRGRKNAKQLTWVLKLKAHHAAGCLTSIAFAMFGLAALICRHLTSGQTDSDEIENENNASVEGMGREKENPAVKTRFYFCNKMFLSVSVILLEFGFFFFFKKFFFFSLNYEIYLKKKKKKKKPKRCHFGSINGNP